MKIKSYIMKRIFLLLLISICALANIGAVEKAKPVVSILGDSYSTFNGYIPEGNASWYFTNTQNGRTDVTDVRQTWWWQFVTEGGYILGINDSYSGATISFTGYRGEDYADRSFITRLPRIVPSDLLLIFGGTNDSWAGVPLGEFTYSKLTRGHLYEFRPAMGKLLREAQNRFPGTRIVFIINSELKAEVTDAIKETCKHYGVEYIELHDIDKNHSHPTVKGMAQIKDQVLQYINTPKK